jgi:hypothetical protein
MVASQFVRVDVGWPDPWFRRGATALPGLRHYQSVPRGFWIGHAHGFIKHLLKVYFEISA